MSSLHEKHRPKTVFPQLLCGHEEGIATLRRWLFQRRQPKMQLKGFRVSGFWHLLPFEKFNLTESGPDAVVMFWSKSLFLGGSLVTKKLFLTSWKVKSSICIQRSVARKAAANATAVRGDPWSHVCQVLGALLCVSPCGSSLGPFWVHFGSILLVV